MYIRSFHSRNQFSFEVRSLIISALSSVTHLVQSSSVQQFLVSLSPFHSQFSHHYSASVYVSFSLQSVQLLIIQLLFMSGYPRISSFIFIQPLFVCTFLFPTISSVINHSVVVNVLLLFSQSVQSFTIQSLCVPLLSARNSSVSIICVIG